MNRERQSSPSSRSEIRRIPKITYSEIVTYLVGTYLILTALSEDLPINVEARLITLGIICLTAGLYQRKERNRR